MSGFKNISTTISGLDAHLRKKFNKYSNKMKLKRLITHENGDEPPAKKISVPKPMPTSKFVRDRMKLPIFRVRNQIVDALKKHDTIIFIGETASGKTTQIPQFVFQEKLNQKMTIAITQPRRVAAIAIATRVASEMNTELGFLVGYSVRFDEKCSDKTRLKYMTDGMLLREAIGDPQLSRYSVIVLDEAHERSIQTDLLFGVVKRAQSLRKSSPKTLKVIIMSATMDVDHFSNYFANAPVYFLAGRQFPIAMKYTKHAQDDYVQAALVTVFQIHQHEEDGDILVFCTGQEEIESMVTTTRATSKHFPEGVMKLVAVPLFAALPHHEQMKVFDPSIKGENRKVIFATNVAETSITIPGVKYVVDTGKVKCRTFQATTGFESLKVESISKAQAQQRAGRAGRECPGVCYRLYTEDQYSKFHDHSKPEILRCSLANVVMQLIAIGISDVKDFNFMDKPNEENIQSAIELLENFKAIEASSDGYLLTKLGKEMVHYPLEPRLARALLDSKEENCSEEFITLIALLYVDNLFHVPHAKREQASEVHKKFLSTEGDHVMFLKVWRAYNDFKSNKEWCRENFINERNMKIAKDVRAQLIRLWDATECKRRSCGSQTEQLRKCLAKGFSDQVARLQRDGSYKVGKLEVNIHPSSCLFGSKPECLIYTELVHTNKLYMRSLSLCDPKWILNSTE
ncbi:ATP-dependent RNA helicase DHX33 [Halotydeus destructor]|nr:ATP-dependent RNA helicase DHX33 [Halotydeus destructor]